MKHLILVLVLAAISLSATPIKANPPPQFQTIWAFVVLYEAGKFSRWEDPMLEGSVTMYTGSSWECKKTAMTLEKDGFLKAGFICGIKGTSQFVVIHALCDSTKVDEDHVKVPIGDRNGFLSVSAHCVTKSTRSSTPAPAGSVHL